MNLTTAKNLVEQTLKQILAHQSTLAPELNAAMSYSVLSGGKRLRPLFVLAACEALEGDPNSALIPACAVELVHCYSLIHDDLPAMDDDDLRHGKPSCHVKYGEAQAILAGDALQTLAFELLVMPGRFQVWDIQSFTCEQLSDTQTLQILNKLAQATGASGMAGGQSLDVLQSNQTYSPDQLSVMHAAKTGSLFAASIVIGGIIAGAKEEKLAHLHQIGQKIGYAFQIVDDILDVTQTTEVLGKPAESDISLGKSTFADHFGVKESQRCADNLLDEIQGLLAELNIERGPLAELTQKSIKRKF